MRAVGITRFGGPEVLEIVELPAPEPAGGQVRIRVAAATVNPADTVLRTGRHGSPENDAPPRHVPGMELAGVIDVAGPGSGWQAGDRVMAIVSPRAPGGGAQAELVVADADQVARVPDGIGLAAAATLPMNGLTARLALDLLALRPGQTLAVTGAAGAVGGYTIQLARAAGLRVIADAAPADAALVRGLGADVVVARGPQVAARMREVMPAGVDALVDAAVQGEQVLSAIRDGGQLAAVRTYRGKTERSIAVVGVLVSDYLHAAGKLAELAGLAADGTLTLRVAAELPAAQAAHAHRLLEAGGVRGRLVLTF
jgi:NADPH:quinone reductase-like Zn-dependent oxidoreductase